MKYTFLFQYSDSETHKSGHTGLDTITVVSNLTVFTSLNGAEVINTEHLTIVADMAMNLMIQNHRDDPNFTVLQMYFMRTNKDNTVSLQPFPSD